MRNSVVSLGALAAASTLACVAAPAEAKAPARPSVQEQLDQMRADYDARIAALEARVAAAEAAQAKAESALAAVTANAPTQADATVDTAVASEDAPTAVASADTAAGADEVQIPDDTAPADRPVNAVTSQNAMNPGISVVLNGNYFASSRDPSTARIPGFELGDEAGLPSRGFSLAESEVTLAANIDPFFTAALTVAFDGEGAANVEEAYVQSTDLPGGLTVKAGRFFSGVGYLNERHAHNWSFIDMPLPYRAFLGGQYGDDGVQVRWLAPTDTYLEFGAEAYRGEGFPAGGSANRGVGTHTAYVHAGGDFNASSSWLAAVSYLHAASDARETIDPLTGPDSFTGDSDVAIASVVYKWAPGGNVIQRNLTLSGEYFRGKENGDFDGVAIDLDRSGWYGQAVYQFKPFWVVGLRYSRLSGDAVPALLAGTALDDAGHDPSAFSLLVEHDSSEFGRFRAQYTRNDSDLRSSDELWLQYTVIYGPHSAHRY